MGVPGNLQEFSEIQGLVVAEKPDYSGCLPIAKTVHDLP